MGSFGGEKSEQYNALQEALALCGKEQGQMMHLDNTDPNTGIYSFTENTPKTSLVVFLVDSLNRLGFEITKSKAK